jgi:hypothetical protein
MASLSRSKGVGSLLVLSIALAAQAGATPLLVGTTLPSTTGSEVAVLGGPGVSPQFLEQSFTLTTSAEVTGISVDMAGFGSDLFTLWLTNAIGPGTTGANVLFQTVLTFPNTGGSFNLAAVSASTSLLLPTGSYFLIASTVDNPTVSEGWGASDTVIPTEFGSVGQSGNAVSSVDTVFPPGSTFVGPLPFATGPLAFQISGSPVPEPQTMFSMLAGIVVLVSLKARRRRAPQLTALPE